MRILIDIDDVIADLQGRVESLWHEQHPDIPLFKSGERKDYYIGSGHSSEYASEIYHMMHGSGFFSSLEPIAGAKQAIDNMIEAGHEVMIVTSSGVSYPLAATEKYQWIENHFGQHMLARLVITPVKFVVSGDILIDDRPEIYRENEANWEHILYDQPYNRYMDKKRRLNWDNWQKVLEL